MESVAMMFDAATGKWLPPYGTMRIRKVGLEVVLCFILAALLFWQDILVSTYPPQLFLILEHNTCKQQTIRNETLEDLKGVTGVTSVQGEARS